jgi:hypothetical protein
MAFHVPDDDLPAVFNPIRYLPFRDNLTEMTVHQMRPGNRQAVADWCEGQVDEADVILPGGERARSGDFVVWQNETFRVEPADGAATRMWPRDQTDDSDPPPLHRPAL